MGIRIDYVGFHPFSGYKGDDLVHFVSKYFGKLARPVRQGKEQFLNKIDNYDAERGNGIMDSRNTKETASDKVKQSSCINFLKDITNNLWPIKF
ncbi:MAG: hypothetical protein GY850_16875 [bacterium]|nr:hypothetical protein [bacterium]